MAHKITLPLPKGWEVEQELILEEGEEVVSYYAYPTIITPIALRSVIKGNGDTQAPAAESAGEA